MKKKNRKEEIKEMHRKANKRKTLSYQRGD